MKERIKKKRIEEMMENNLKHFSIPKVKNSRLIRRVLQLHLF